MISTDFAPNESWDDAWLSFKLLFQPWRWKSGKELIAVKTQIVKLFNVTSYILHVSLFLTGRSALYTLLKSLNLPKNSAVIVQAFTCEAVVLPIIANNLKPIYVDIESETYSMDVHKIANKLTAKSKVLILQHTFGFTPQYRNAILELAKKRGLTIIEDLAHGFDPQILKSNNLKSKVYYLLSFGRSKSISSVFGGAIISSNNLIIKQSNKLSYPSYWFIFRYLLYKPLTMFIKSTYDLYIGKLIHKIAILSGLLIPEITAKEKEGEYDTLLEKGYPNGLAALLSHQLKKFEQINKNRPIINAIYIRRFNEVSSRTCFGISEQMLNPASQRGKQVQHDKSALIRFPLLITNRDDVLVKLRKQNIYLGKWYDQVVAPRDLDLKRVGYKSGSCPKAEEICKNIINLPTNISEEEARKIINAFNDVKLI